VLLTDRRLVFLKTYNDKITTFSTFCWSHCRINFVSDFRLPHWSLLNTAALTAKSLCCCEYSLVCVSCYLRDIYEYLMSICLP